MEPLREPTPGADLTSTSTPDTAARHGSARSALTVASLGFFLITLDILIVNVALTDVRRALGGGTSGQQWVVDGYTLLFASLLLLAGNLSDRLGARRTFALGVAGFGLASTACALAPSIGALVAGRVVQGGAAAIMLPASMSLVSEAFPDLRERARALGVWAAGGAVAAAAGPLAGGLLTTLSWRWVFAVNIPVCAGILLLMRAVAPSPTRPASFDLAGQLTAVVALSGLVYGLIVGGSDGFGSTSVVLVLVAAALALVAFVVLQARGAHPMLPLTLLQPSAMQLALAAGAAFMVAWYGTVFVTSLFLQQELGFSPIHTGLLFLPSAAASLVGNLVSGRLTNTYGPRFPIVLGLASMVLGTASLAATTHVHSTVLLSAQILLVGAGGSVCMPPMSGVVLAAAPSGLSGTASAAFNTFRQVGGALAVAVFGALVAGAAGFEHGMRLSFSLAAAIALCVTVGALRVPLPHERG